MIYQNKDRVIFGTMLHQVPVYF